LVWVQTCEDDQDVLLAAAGGKCIRFPVKDVRVFAGRNSTGVRGIRLAKGDEVISMSILRHMEFSVEERKAYLKRRRLERMEGDEEAVNGNGEVDADGEENGAAAGEGFVLDDDRYAEMLAGDQYILTLAANGYGKRSSAYEYTVRGRGGQGIGNIDLGSGEDNSVVSSFPVSEGDQLVLVTDKGQTIRTSVDEIRIAGRSTRGVIVFRVAEDERVVSVSWMGEAEEEDEGEDAAPESAPGENVEGAGGTEEAGE
ncbi:MAG: DNA gyrase subunit A, partial [Alphaproteobacteria bacterium]|nr:DNA gyrase subunit A [Alphaproteobacteria bacterium]